MDGLTRYTVIGTFTDATEADGTPQRYASYFWADDPEHAIEQAHDETATVESGTLIIGGVLVGEVEVAW